MLILDQIGVLETLSFFPKFFFSFLFIGEIKLICVIFGFVWNWILSYTFFGTDDFILYSFFLLNCSLWFLEFFSDWISFKNQGSRPLVNKRLNRFFFDRLILSNFVHNAP
jgi:hypothetical protein